MMNRTILPSLAALAFLIPFQLFAQDPAAPSTPDAANSASSDYVSRAEYDKLKAEHEAMKKELDALKTAVRQMASGTVPAGPREPETPAEAPSGGKQVVGTTSATAATDELRQEVETLKTQVKETFPGSTKFL